MRILALALLLLAPLCQAQDSAWRALEEGGHVVLIRHAPTVPGTGDPPGMRLEECGTQRNLSDEGRAHARRIGETFAKKKIAVERVLSSPWCRCLETARLAFREPEVSQSLGNLFGRQENRERQVREMRAIVAAWKGRGNLVLVTHGSTVHALTGVSPGTGELVVLAPRRGGFELAGRLAVD